MNLALQTAWRAQLFAFPNPSVGALILDKNNAIIALRAHEKYGQSHAELLAFKDAYIALSGDKSAQNLSDPFEIYNFLIKNHNGIFAQTTLFVTLSPCAHVGKTPSCAEFLCAIKPKRVFISTNDLSKNAQGGAQMLKKSGIEVRENVLEKKGRDLIFPFLCAQEKGAFSLYKIAMRANGVIDGGVISSLPSREFSHTLRNLARRIIISQKTTLSDDPILDSRLVNGRAPDVTIIGRSDKVSKRRDLRVFSVQNRSVEFCNNINDVKFEGLNVFEGGAEFFNLVREKIDCVLAFVSPQMRAGLHFSASFEGRILHSMQIGDDVALWIKP